MPGDAPLIGWLAGLAGLVTALVTGMKVWRDASNAAKGSVMAGYRDLVEDLRTEIADLRRQVKDNRTESREQIKELTGKVTALEADGVADRTRITRLETLLSHAASYIEALLRWAHALRDAPKPPPLPTELHELVDPQLWITITNPRPPQET